MNESLSAISQELQEEHHRLTEQSEVLSNELRQVDEHLKRVRSALKALAGKAPSKKAGRTNKPCASKAEVVSIIEKLLGSEPGLSVANLQKRVEQQVVQSGKSRMGLALRFKEALAMPCFKKSERGVILTTNGSVSEK